MKMATTINTYYDRVKLLSANTLAALETAINGYITGDDSGLEEGEHVTDIDIDITSDPQAPWQPVYVATLSIVGSTTV
jgi:hypothetical protein